ncbi:MAG TPA: sulfite exporter TauE/SafE family protein [Rhodocyclaceae bacterium]|jgi:hypothetical protein
MTGLPASFLILDDPFHLFLAVVALVVAYGVFTLAGFGSALVASGPLALVMPVSRVIPLLALLDCTGSAHRGWKLRHKVDRAELKVLLPGMLLGQLLGVFVLIRIAPWLMALLLGAFITVQGLKGLHSRTPSASSLGTGWRSSALFHGLLGGVLGGLFGSGGFMYASYLERRLDCREAFRATQSVLIALSTAWRIGLCIFAGLLDGSMLVTAVMLLPAMALGVALGHRVDLHLSRAQLFKLLSGLLVLSGLSLILRYSVNLLARLWL